MKNLLKLTTALLLCVCLPLGSATAEPRKKAKTFSINFENTDIRSALELLAARAGLRLSASDEVMGNINYSFANVTLDGALKQISRENGLNYKYSDNGFLLVTKAFGGNERAPASEGLSNSRHLKLKYITVQEAFDLVNPLAGKDDRLIRDQPTNSLVFMGSDATFSVIRDTIATFDQMPQQILIEAHIVELNKNQSREFGFSYGYGGLTGGNTDGTASITNPSPKRANFAMQLGLGQIDGTALAMRLAAAEVEGAAKILSRPKVVTINNKPATITSGISYSIRTLAAVSSGGSGSTDKAVASGVATVSAGLNLSVTPTVVGDDQVKLTISVSNSEPDETTVIDGIPGIIKNSTNTEIIVQNGKTASVAGLIKNSFAESETGLPFLRKIPLLGWLFSSKAKSDRDKELMVFITPKIVERQNKELDNNMEELQKKFPEVVLKKPMKKTADAEERLPATQQ